VLGIVASRWTRSTEETATDPEVSPPYPKRRQSVKRGFSKKYEHAREAVVPGKLAKYARAGIRRYWVVDLDGHTIHDHRDPDRFGQRYRQLHSLSEGTLSVTVEGVEIQVDAVGLLGAVLDRGAEHPSHT
jgi:hypothetical protein